MRAGDEAREAKSLENKVADWGANPTLKCTTLCEICSLTLTNIQSPLKQMENANI